MVDWSRVDKEEYLSAMERSPIKDIDHSYYYEGYAEYKAEEL